MSLDRPPDSDLTPETVGAGDTGDTRPPRPARPLDAPPGELLFGKFEPLGELARGGMGVVIKARQVDLGRVVAIKVLKEGEEASAEQVARFHREAELAARLRHPHIVTIHEVGVDRGRHYFTMDWIQGETLEARLRRARMPHGQAAALLEKVARALHFAHTKGIVHRDVKPANVLLDEAGEPQVTDFGLARAVDLGSTLTRPGAAIGTPFYMSPEQISGQTERVDARSDVFSLGVVLYEMLAGRRPFAGNSAVEVFHAITLTEPPPLRKAAPGVPRDLATACERAIEKDRERRYPTALALAEDLARFQRGEPIQAKAIGWLERQRRLVRRNPVAASIALAAVALLGAGLGVGLHLRNQYAKESQSKETALARSRYDTLVAEGAFLARQGRFADAMKGLDAAVAADPSRPTAYKDRAYVHRERKEWKEAIAEYDLAIARDASDAELFYFRGTVERELGETAQAEKDISESIRLRPGVAGVLNARGCLRYDRGDDAGAIEDITAAIAADPSDAEFYTNRGLCLGRQNRLAEAERDFTSALDRNPRADYALLHRAILRSQLGRTDPAIEDLARYINVRPDDAEGYFWRGSLRVEAERFADGLLDLDVAIRIDPSRWKAHLNRALAKMGLGKGEEARADLDQAVSLAPKEPQPYLKRSILHLDAGRGAEALADCDACLSLAPDLAEAHWNRALALEALGRKADAAAEWKAYLSRWPDDPQAEAIRKHLEELR